MIAFLLAALALQDAALREEVFKDTANLVAVVAACDDVLPPDVWPEVQRALVVAIDVDPRYLDETFAAHRVAIEAQYSPSERRQHFTLPVCTARFRTIWAKTADDIWRVNQATQSQP